MTSLTKLFSSSGAAAERPGSCGAEASLLAPAPIFVRIAYRWAAIAFCAAMLAATLACSNENKAAATKQQVVVDPNIFTVDHPELFQTVKVETRDLPTELNTNGTVQPDVNKTIRVTSLGSGRVADLKVRLGDSVKKGQVLLIISSPDLAGALGDYQKASELMNSWPAKPWNALNFFTRTGQSRKKIWRLRRIPKTRPRPISRLLKAASG